jgi:uncharacterized membrane protein YqjE
LPPQLWKALKTLFSNFCGLDNLVDNLSGYLETRFELFKVEVREDVSRVLAQALMIAAILLLSILFLLFFSVGLAHFFNGVISNNLMLAIGL